MKLKKLVQVMLIGVSIVAISACSTTHKNKNGTGAMGEDGAQVSGLGQDQNWGDGQSGSGAQASSKRTYYFDYDRSDVRESDKPAINAVADYLVAHPNAKITIQGHTDPRGSREYNVALGEHRGDAVLEVLKARGVNPDQVRVVSYGAEQLAVPGRSEQDFQLDRRAVIVMA